MSFQFVQRDSFLRANISSWIINLQRPFKSWPILSRPFLTFFEQAFLPLSEDKSEKAGAVFK